MKKVAMTSARRAELRGRAHGLDPVVMIGDDGLTPGVLKEIEVNLTAHELIKIRVFGDDREARSAMLETICAETNALPVQQIGKLLVVYRRAPKEKSSVAAPTSKRGAAPREVLVVKPSRTGRKPPTRKVVTVLGSQRVTAGGKIKKAKPRQKSVKRD